MCYTLYLHLYLTLRRGDAIPPAALSAGERWLARLKAAKLDASGKLQAIIYALDYSRWSVHSYFLCANMSLDEPLSPATAMK